MTKRELKYHKRKNRRYITLGEIISINTPLPAYMVLKNFENSFWHEEAKIQSERHPVTFTILPEHHYGNLYIKKEQLN